MKCVSSVEGKSTTTLRIHQKNEVEGRLHPTKTYQKYMELRHEPKMGFRPLGLQKVRQRGHGAEDDSVREKNQRMERDQ